MNDRLIDSISEKLNSGCSILGRERKYRNAAVLIPLVEIDGHMEMLFQVRAEHIRQGGEVAFPGGIMEPEDEGDYRRTAIRETSEELGIPEDSIKTIAFMGTYVATYDVTVDVYVGILKIDSVDQMPLSDEVSSVFTVELSDLMASEPEIHYIHHEIQQSFMDEDGDEVTLLDASALGLPNRYHRPSYTRRRKIFFYRKKGHTIWGMTGEMLYEFLAMIG